jgi:hypothetical protein
VTLQLLNYRRLPNIIANEIVWGARHCVLLGFLPHGDWFGHVTEIAVHPAELRPYIEQAADRLLAAGTPFTIRYHPLCHLRPDLWKYVVNTLYCQFDNTEWNYILDARDPEVLWRYSVTMNDSVAHHGEPCDSCSARLHCGAINRHIFTAFNGAGLRAIQEPPEEYAAVWQTRGGLHDLNPAARLPSKLRSAP